MYRNILRKLNFGIFILITLAAVTVQTTIFGYFPLNYLQPDIVLILSVYFGLRRSIFEGAAFVFLAAILLESHSSTGQHFLLTTYLYAFVISQILSKMIIVSDLLSATSVVVVLSLLKRIGISVLLGMQGRATNGFKHFLIFLIPTLLVQGLLTPILFPWFKSIDMKTYKDEQADDEYDINREF